MSMCCKAAFNVRYDSERATYDPEISNVGMAAGG